MSEPTSFATLKLRPELISNLSELGYSQMTAVQARTLPKLLVNVDVLARAKTGSGKTAAFGLGLLNKLSIKSHKVQALVLCPTRELADQVAGEIRRLARSIPNIKISSFCGGVPLGPQMASLQHSPHIIVGTPGRLLKLLGKGVLDLKDLQTLVLDEADRMLDMGFTDELNKIITYLPVDRQTLLFSATYPKSIAAISARVQRKPQIVDVTDNESPAAITQYWCTVTRENRGHQLVRALRAWGGVLNLVFCNTKVDCESVVNQLRAKDIAAVALHGDLDQSQRTQVLVRFANKSASVLVATDVAARGLDVKDLDAVFNYELPRQPEVYVHRIGRTGRAEREGVALSLVEEREMPRLLAIEKMLKDTTIRQHGIPDPSRSAAHLVPAMATIQINGGRKNKLRKGDFLGALTAEGGVPSDAVGSIDLFDTYCYVAVDREALSKALRQLSSRPIKGRKYRARVSK